MSKKFNLYLGQAGQTYVMSEFLCRGWNAAIPLVDVGDDIFVVDNENGIFYTVQVKTAHGKANRNGFSVQYNLSLPQLKFESNFELFYAFVVRFQDEWQQILIIPRQQLFPEVNQQNVGNIRKDKVILYFRFKNDGTVLCSNRDFSQYLNNWSDFPTILH